MRKLHLAFVGILLSLLLTQPAFTQKKNSKQSTQLKTMTWTSKSEAAKTLASEGANYFMNIEFPQAYETVQRVSSQVTRQKQFRQ